VVVDVYLRHRSVHVCNTASARINYAQSTRAAFEHEDDKPWKLLKTPARAWCREVRVREKFGLPLLPSPLPHHHHRHQFVADGTPGKGETEYNRRDVRYDVAIYAYGSGRIGAEYQACY